MRNNIFNIKPRGDIAILTGLLAAAVITGAVFNNEKIDRQVLVASEKLELMRNAAAPMQKLSVEKAVLEGALKVATAEPKPQHLTPDEAREMIALTFPKELRARFEKITMHCENGKLDTDIKGYNKNGTYDIGMSQINSYWHKERVEKMFGMPFDTAMSIPILNYIYASFLVEHAGNFELWSCDRKV